MVPAKGTPSKAFKVRISGYTRKRSPTKPTNKANSLYEDTDKEIKATLIRAKTQLGGFSARKGACLELPCRFNLSLENLSSAEPQSLKSVAVALFQKLQVLNLRATDWEATQELLSALKGPQSDLAQAIHKTKHQTQAEEALISGILQEIQEENESLIQELSTLEVRRSEIKQIKEILEGTSTVPSQDALSELVQEENEYDEQSEIEAIAQQGALAVLQGSMAITAERTARTQLLDSLGKQYSQRNLALQQEINRINKGIEHNAVQSNKLKGKLELDLTQLKTAQDSIETEQIAKEAEKAQFHSALDAIHSELDKLRTFLEHNKQTQGECNSLFTQFASETDRQQDVLYELPYFADLVLAQAQTGLTAHRLLDVLRENAYQETSLQRMIQSQEQSHA